MITKLDIEKGMASCIICDKQGEGKLITTTSIDSLAFVCKGCAAKLKED